MDDSNFVVFVVNFDLEAIDISLKGLDVETGTKIYTVGADSL